MNYKFPLVNLITRGHVRTENPRETINFINTLNDKSAYRLYEQLLLCEDANLAARLLEGVQEEFDLKFGSIKNPSDDSFNQQRDYFFLKESNDSTEVASPAAEAQKILKMISTGIPIATIILFLKNYDKKTRDQIITNVGLVRKDVADLLNKSWIGRPIVKGAGFTKRLGSYILTGKNSFTDTDKKIGKGIGWAAIAAVGVVAMALMISSVYKQFFSEAAKKCKQYSGRIRTICMTKVRIEAAKEAQRQAEKALTECDSAKNPEDCRFKMRVEIRSWMKKRRKDEEELQRLTRVRDDSFTKPKKPNPFE